MSSKKFIIIGIGDDGLESLPQSNIDIITKATKVIGGKRHLSLLPDAMVAQDKKQSWQSPISAHIQQLDADIGGYYCVLASGNPLHYGVAKWFLHYHDADTIEIMPHHSAFTLASAQLQWQLQDCNMLTIHGRPMNRIIPYLQPNAQLLILTSNGGDVAKIADIITQKHIIIDEFIVCEHLGGDKENIITINHDDIKQQQFADLNLVAIKCATTQPHRQSQYHSLDDNAYIHNGKITKSEIRAITMRYLAPAPQQILWDLGAGAGSVAIEWVRCGGVAYAIEHQEQQIALIEENALNLGACDVQIIHGRNRDMIVDLPSPDAVFIGGGLTKDLIDAVIAKLNPCGRLVVNSVTLESEAILLHAFQEYGGDLRRIAIDRADRVGDKLHGWRAAMPVTQWVFINE